MNNEFGYLDVEPFTSLNEEEQKLAIINQKEDNLEMKVQDIEKFSTFNCYSHQFGKLIETGTFYGINSNWNPLTLYHCTIKSSKIQSIPHSIITSKMYVIGNQTSNHITHFTDKTKIKKIRYYNDNIKYIFPSNSMTITRKIDELNIQAKTLKEQKILKINYAGNEITIKLINTYQYNQSIYNLNIKPLSYLEIGFSKFVDVEMVLKVSHRLDSIIHLFLFTKGRSKTLTMYDTRKNSYELFCLGHDDIEEKQPLYYLDKKENNISNFAKLFSLLINIDDNNDNFFFPFLNFDRKINSIEIQFLEYYRVLEYINTDVIKRRKGEYTDPFLLKLLPKYPKLKKFYFNDQEDKIIEEEIRSLRNYYSHSGYYIKNLPIPTFDPKRYKSVDVQWLHDVRGFIKAVAYLEVYALADINVDETYLMYHLK